MIFGYNEKFANPVSELLIPIAVEARPYLDPGAIGRETILNIDAFASPDSLHCRADELPFLQRIAMSVVTCLMQHMNEGMTLSKRGSTCLDNEGRAIIVSSSGNTQAILRGLDEIFLGYGDNIGTACTTVDWQGRIRIMIQCMILVL